VTSPECVRAKKFTRGKGGREGDLVVDSFEGAFLSRHWLPLNACVRIQEGEGGWGGRGRGGWSSRVCACVQTNTYVVYVFETNSVYVCVYGCTCMCVCVWMGVSACFSECVCACVYQLQTALVQTLGVVHIRLLRNNCYEKNGKYQKWIFLLRGYAMQIYVNISACMYTKTINS